MFTLGLLTFERWLSIARSFCFYKPRCVWVRICAFERSHLSILDGENASALPNELLQRWAHGIAVEPPVGIGGIRRIYPLLVASVWAPGDELAALTGRNRRLARRVGRYGHVLYARRGLALDTR